MEPAGDAPKSFATLVPLRLGVRGSEELRFPDPKRAPHSEEFGVPFVEPGVRHSEENRLPGPVRRGVVLRREPLPYPGGTGTHPDETSAQGSEEHCLLGPNEAVLPWPGVEPADDAPKSSALLVPVRFGARQSEECRLPDPRGSVRGNPKSAGYLTS